MKTLDLDQGSTEWMMARLGIPTASKFDRLLTPKTRKPAAARALYCGELVAEWAAGQPEDWGGNPWTEHGKEMEKKGRQWYEMDRGVDVTQVGLVLRDDGLVAGSPDGLVGTDGGLEIKNLKWGHHAAYEMGLASLAADFVGQPQGYMYLTGRKWWDLLSYNHTLPPVVVRVARDEDYIAALVAVLGPFIEQVEAGKRRYTEYRIPRPWDPDQVAEMEAQR